MSVTRNFGPLDQIKLTDKAIMRDVGLMARERIVRRTRQGQGTDKPLAPYSASYAAQKAKELGTAAPVNLTVSGSMLNDIVLGEVTDDSVELKFSK